MPAPPRLHRAGLGRADLLRLLGSGVLEPAAAGQLCGFEYVAVTPPNADGPSSPTGGRIERQVDVAVPTAPLRALQATHFALTVEPLVEDPLPQQALDEATVLHHIPQADPTCQAPLPQPLVPRRRMASFVHRSLRRPASSGRLDVDQWLRLSLRGGAPPQRLPMRMLPRWGAAASLVINAGDGSAPLDFDLRQLASDVLTWSGGATQVFWVDAHADVLSVHLTRGRALAFRSARFADVALARHWLWAGPHGMAGVADAAAWPRRLSRVLHRGGQVLWLRPGALPTPASVLPPAIHVAAWEYGGQLHQRSMRFAAPPVAEMVLQRLLAAMSLAIRIEPALLRALRLDLGLPTSAELQAWMHADVGAYGHVCVLQQRLEDHRRSLKEDLPLHQRQRLARLIAEHHRHLSPLVQMEEAALAADLASDGMAWGQARPWLDVARTLRDAPQSPAAAALARYVRRTGERAHPGIWNSPGLSEAWVLSEAAAIRAGASLPPGLAPARVRQLLPAAGPRGAAVSLVQAHESLWLQTGRQGNALHVFGADAGGLIMEHGDERRWLLPDQVPALVAEAGARGPWLIASATQAARIARLPRPAWAQEWGRDARGLYALTPPLGNLQERIDAPIDEPIDPAHPPLQQSAAEWRSQPLSDGRVTLGVDKLFGAYAELNIGGVVQRLCWIPPGSFMMGSRDEEWARIGDKRLREQTIIDVPRHQVHISTGFWLADSACTQALWMAVMGDNPSQFRDDPNCPVEQVSWDDVQHFLQRLQRLLPPDCLPVLPTEAQWEYACRAGSDTAFSFGDRISDDQVNFYGEDDFGHNSRKPRDRTVPVKSLPANGWGLYEMHGNVLEWCDDGMRIYDAEPRFDPTGPVESGPQAHCAVRGGSWITRAWRARSAHRFANLRGYRNGFLGFRWSLRSLGLAAPEGLPGDSRSVVNPRRPPHFPPAWADAWGDDRFGLWAEFSIGDVRQRMRWIEPGQFMMGSPADEPEHDRDEGLQHLVCLSAGFWLADTACTQALWVIVTGADNPSRYSDDDRCPVEQVSWDDVQGFLRRLGEELGPAAEPALPTEAQWEYACRAGSTTPFSFGTNVTPAQVNYDGTEPYNGAAAGTYRERTVPVKSLPPNRWGLYEMHGNVWEWCADATRPYGEAPGEKPLLDPQGPLEQGPEAPRAVRGGSWFNPARRTRSAYRYANERGERYVNLGFRLSLRS